MRLKSLKLSGFKSFANPTTFTFKQNITAIVGPNGCGKSNVIDAIRWVLGESSAKQLRGGAMSDVIFAGTENKAAKSLASVTLTFEHTQDEQTGIRHELNLYHELSVRRQVNKDGKSDYFINETRCRRRDVVDVFLGTGLGARSYSVIQQGMIGRIVESNPMQLREFIEEAAGISRYQARREETQKKLLKTQENLDRLNDIEAELTRQKKKLAKQAESAIAYQTVQDALNQTKEQLAIKQLQQAKSAEIAYKETQAELSKQVESLQQSAQVTKQKLSKLTEQLAQEQWLKDAARDALHEQDMAHQKVAHELSSLEATIEQLQSRLQANERRQADINTDITTLTEKLQSYKVTKDEVSPKLERLLAQKEQMTARYTPLQAAWEHTRQRMIELETSKKEIEQKVALHMQALDQRQTEKQRWQSRWQAWESEAIKWQVADGSISAESTNVDSPSSDDVTLVSANDIAKIEQKINRLIQQKEGILEDLEASELQLNTSGKALEEAQSTLAQLEKQHTRLVAEYDTLHGIVYRKKDKQASIVGREIQPNYAIESNRAFDALPTLVDTIKLTDLGENYAEVLDKWLAFWLDSRIADSGTSSLWSDLLADMTNEDGEQFNNINSVLSVKTSSAKTLSNSQEDVLNEQTNLKSLSSLIAEPKLALFDYCYLFITDNNDINQEEKDKPREMLSKILNTLPSGSMILTQTDWLVTQAGLIHLNKLAGAGQNEQFLATRLHQQTQLEALEAQLTDIEDKIESLTQQVQQKKGEYEQLVVAKEESLGQVNALTHQEHELKQKRTQLTGQYERIHETQQRLMATKQQLDSERAEFDTAIETLTTEQEKAKAQLNELLPKLEAMQSQQTTLEHDRQSIAQQEREINDAYAKMQLVLNKAEVENEHNQQQIQKLTAELERLQRMQETLNQQYDKASQQLPSLEQQVAKAQQASHEQQIALDERQVIINALQTQSQQLHKASDENEQKRQPLQNELNDYTTKVAIAQERIIEATERLKVLDSSISPSAVLTDYIAHGRTQTKEKIAQQIDTLQSKEQQLTKKISAMGAVNLAATAELDAVNERLLPLEQQLKDITDSVDKLQDAIASIDAKTKTLFLETLEAVNISLAKLFKKVFGGGQASLTLVSEDGVAKSEQWRAGLELMAQPKGKRNSRLAVLSGGEKTLTALSLIFAIFKQHPAPFCVLDEVDAPLDDANVTRFTHLIHELANEVQFIFISHNKLAMQIADELKGVTMPQAGVSSLVSVSLAEAESYLDPLPSS